MKLTFLGTGAGIPSKQRNVTAIILDILQEINELWLFDCGEATQHQLLYTTIKPRKITKIFITHLHGDHIFGLPGLLSSRSFQGGNQPLEIYGPKGIQTFVETSLKVSASRLAYPISFHEVNENGVIFESDKFTVTTQSLHHGVTSLAYKVKEHDQLGALNVDKLKALNIEPGPIYQQIKAHEKTVLPNGDVVFRKDVIGEDKKGRTLCIFGDTTYLPDLKTFIQGIDVLVHEATYENAMSSLAKDHFHSTASQAAHLAVLAKVKTLILTHISSRYQLDGAQQLLREAQAIFPNSFLASDYFSFEIK